MAEKTPTLPLSLAERMAGVMANLKSIPKNGKMVMGGKPIPYVANDDLMDALRPVLGAAGIAHSISVEDVRKGLAEPVGTLLNIRLACGEEAMDSKAYGEGRTFPIAQTYAVKYWLLRTFLVGSGGEDDEAANVAHGNTGQQQRQGPAPADRIPQSSNGNGQSKADKGKMLAGFWAIVKEKDLSQEQAYFWLTQKGLAPYDEQKGRASLTLASPQEMGRASALLRQLTEKQVENLKMARAEFREAPAL